MTKHKLIIAAGGILSRIDSGQSKYVIVKTAKNGYWCLPKGKPTSTDLSLLETAVREVQEETGCKVDALDYAGDFRYGIGNASKLVLMWHMKLTKEDAHPLFSDISEIRWLNALEAIALLSRKRERRFLASALNGNVQMVSNQKLKLIERGKTESHLKDTIRLPDTVEFDFLTLKK